MSQPEIVEAAQRGDHDAFEALAVSVSARLYSVARLILQDTHLAEDAVQEALVHLWRHLPALRDPDRFDAWAYRVIVNACADAGRTRRRLSVEVRLVSPLSYVGDASLSAADRDQLDRAFRHLTPDQRAALVLHAYVGLSARDVAQTLNVPLGTAKSRIHYARQIMRAAIEADDRPASSGPQGRLA
jgi:RNA polymerase sigma-70 factor, ECF subfamily